MQLTFNNPLLPSFGVISKNSIPNYLTRLLKYPYHLQIYICESRIYPTPLVEQLVDRLNAEAHM